MGKRIALEHPAVSPEAIFARSRAGWVTGFSQAPGRFERRGGVSLDYGPLDGTSSRLIRSSSRMALTRGSSGGKGTSRGGV